MRDEDFKRARESYLYVPAKLEIADQSSEPDVTWDALRLKLVIPSQADWSRSETRAHYSSAGLDDFHNALLYI